MKISIKDNEIEPASGLIIQDTWDDREKLLCRQKESFFICQSSLAFKQKHWKISTLRDQISTYQHWEASSLVVTPERMSNNERILKEDMILQCQEAFNQFDHSNSGLVATKDLGNLLRALGINPTNEELQVDSERKFISCYFHQFYFILHGLS